MDSPRSPGDTGPRSAIVADFLIQYLADRQAGADVGLDEYQRRYPGHADLIAQEYASVVAEADAPSSERSHGPFAAFLSQYGRDLRRGEARSLEDYLALFPGDADRIARQYLALQDRSDPVTSQGEMIGPYRMVELIGRGGQALVYLAEDTRLHRNVALKLISGLGAFSGEALSRFRREAEITSHLDHPGISKVYDAGDAAGVSYIAMQHIAGETLARKIQSERAPDGVGPPGRPSEIIDVVRFFEKTARALHAAHEAGVVHRDVKPGNVMVTPEREPVLLDFGLARQAEAEYASLTGTGLLVGTPAYMSPEQLSPESHVIDRRSDVYSLGVSLFECLTHERPFQAPTRDALQRRILTRDPPDPHRLNRCIPKDLSIVVLTAIAKDRDHRYQTAWAFAEDLRRFREHEPILARPPGPLTRLLRFAQRKPALAAAILVLAAGAVVSTTFAVKAASNLAEWSRLADGRRIQDLISEAEGPLWPAVPSKIPALEEWLREAKALLARLPDHEEALTALRGEAKPYTEADRDADRSTHRAQLDALARRERQRPEDAEDSAAAADSASAAWNADPARLESVLSERLTWKFDDPLLQWRHDKLSELVRDLRGLGSNRPPKPSLETIEQRLDFARTLHKRTVDDHAGDWAACLGRVARNHAYGPGTLTAPLTGLIPVGPDSASGLEEFCETATGEPPLRDRATGQIAVTEATALVFVLLPGGTFTMGAQNSDPAGPNYDPQSRRAEWPPHRVEVAPFLLSKFEMTQGQYLRATGTNPSYHRAGSMLLEGRRFDLRNPVENVTWEDCQRTLSRLGLSLPTERQWEYACRAGTDTPWPSGAADHDLAKSANLADATLRRRRSRGGAQSPGGYELWNDGYAEPAPVGQLAANGFGLHDMIGNVFEWCEDVHAPYSSESRPDDGSPGSLDTGDRVIRGGAFDHRASQARSAIRARNPPSHSARKLGMRPARAMTSA